MATALEKAALQEMFRRGWSIHMSDAVPTKTEIEGSIVHYEVTAQAFIKKNGLTKSKAEWDADINEVVKALQI